MNALKTKYIYILLLLATMACDDQIFPTLDDGEPVVVIDAFINNKNEPQSITVSQTQPYLNETELLGIEDANVSVTYGVSNTSVVFDHDSNGVYTVDSGFGAIGDNFTLTVVVDGETFVSYSSMNRVPAIDSVTFRYEEFAGFGQDLEFYMGEFWSRDLAGPGDTYWIKAYKNGSFLGKPEELSITFDAGFSSGGIIDDVIFIQPIRDSVNPFDEEDNGDFISPYADGDSLYVEIHSITNETFNYLNELITQTDVEGGFAALFASPLENLNGNIENTNENSDEVALGFFSVSAVEGNGKRLDISEVPIEE